MEEEDNQEHDTETEIQTKRTEDVKFIFRLSILPMDSCRKGNVETVEENQCEKAFFE